MVLRKLNLLWKNNHNPCNFIHINLYNKIMAAKRKIEIFKEIQNEKEFQYVLRSNENTLICAEIYCYFAGHCTALDNLFTTIKLDWSNGNMILLKVPADEIKAFDRFRNHSEPVYMFILRGKATKVFRGVNNLLFAEVAKRELLLWNKESQGLIVDRPVYELDEPTTDEMEWLTKLDKERTQEAATKSAVRSSRQAARKRHRAELMVPHLQNLNFVLFWPHCRHAHPELYERWDEHNIIMVGRELLKLTEEQARDILYAGDAPLNEASLQKLLEGEALAICFRLLDTDGPNFVDLVRKILYEDLPSYDDSKPEDQQKPRVPAFDRYKTYSPTREQLWQQRREDWMKRREEEIERRARRLSEMQRMARQAIEEALEARKNMRENRRMELLKAGNLTALDQVNEESDEEIDIKIPEELPDEMVEEEIREDENEDLPPPGLLIPGFYAPPNEVAKVNGLAVLFPKIVAEYVIPAPEFLPPHVLVMIDISKRYKAIGALSKHKSSVIHIGIFRATTPFNGVHIAYSVKQYDTLDISLNPEELKLALMLSTQTDLPLLVLMELSPVHVSRDEASGEDECAAIFPLGYADGYDDLEDFH